ncbi:MAG: coenzyme F420-0:L-glutamate ligase, partial [Clostridia bacterium]|nr:coenzyme F420-0:L-glutamate ligase [Clostridia bacterium]
GGTIGVIFPILSRNRFAICLRGLAGGVKKVVIMLSYPADEVGKELVLEIQKRLLEATGKHLEVMVYGDGAFKDPQGKIWELADPVVSPAFTDGLIGTPNELKLKYLADNEFKDLSGEELRDAISAKIRAKDGSSLVGNMAAQGTTPRQLTDLIGSLCDLTSGSGDKGTPVVLVQGYFDNYTSGK